MVTDVQTISVDSWMQFSGGKVQTGQNLSRVVDHGNLNGPSSSGDRAYYVVGGNGGERGPIRSLGILA